MESISGLSLNDVKVHRNSDKPAQLQAHAYAQGTDIHLGPGQEKHLPHELGHVVQQKEGRVKPTVQLKDKVNINDDSGLEKEATDLGVKAQKIGGVNLIKAEVAQLKFGDGFAVQVKSSNSKVTQLNPFDKKESYVKLDKVDPETIAIKGIGKELIAVYHLMDEATKEIEKDKNSTALKNVALGLAQAGVQIATMCSGIPGVFKEAEISLEGIQTPNLGVESAAQQVGSMGAGFGLGLQEEGEKPQEGKTDKGMVSRFLTGKDTPSSLEKAKQKTTTGGVIKGIVYDKIGTLENVCKTLIGLIPFAGAAQNIVKGTKQALQSDGDWAKNQSKVISLLFDIEKNISEVIKSIDVENFGDTQIVSANKTIFFNHTRRTLTEVLAKYQAKALIFHKANAKWQSENPESIGLLQQEIEDDGLMK